MDLICWEISQNQEVSAEDLEWAEALAESDNSAAAKLRVARRKAQLLNQ